MADRDNMVRGLRRVRAPVSLSGVAADRRADFKKQENKAAARQSPCLSSVYEESHSKRTTTRQQLVCARTLV